MEQRKNDFHIDRRFILIAAVVAAVCTAVICTAMWAGSREHKRDSYLETGNRYLSEMDYEQAIASYQAALKIDPKCVDAYIGLAEAYTALGELNMASETLRQGYELTEAEPLNAKLEEIKALMADDAGNIDGDSAQGNIGNGDDGPSQAEGDRPADESEAGAPVFVPWAEAGLEDHVMEWGDEGLAQGMREVTNITDRDIMLSDVWERKFLSISDKNITDISALGELTNLTELSLWNNQISDISPLASLVNLTRLELFHNQISDISSLASLTKLVWLKLDYNQISDISPLASLNGLTLLHLSSNQISDVTPLASLTDLTELSLDFNQVGDVSSLESLTKLTSLNLDYNQISDVSPLALLANLTRLSVGNNPVSDYSSLDNFAEGVVSTH